MTNEVQIRRPSNWHLGVTSLPLRILAEIQQDAVRAPGGTRPTNPSPVANEEHVSGVAIFGRDDLLQQILRAVGRGVVRDQAQPPGYPVDVGIDRQNVALQIEEQDAGSGLLADALDAGEELHGLVIIEVVEKVWGDGAGTLPDGSQGALNGQRFLVGQTAAANRVGDVGDVGIRHRVPIGKGGLEIGERAFGVDVGRALREDRSDQPGDRIAAALACRFTLVVAQAVEDRRSELHRIHAA